MTKEKLILKVYKVSASNQKLITIPKVSKISDGDYVKVEKVD